MRIKGLTYVKLYLNKKILMILKFVFSNVRNYFTLY